MDTNSEPSSNNTNEQIDDPTVQDIVGSICFEPQFSDVTFLVAGKKLHAHKAILAGKSQVFKDLFVTNADKKVIEIPSTSAESFRLLLKFIYTGNIPSSSNVNLLLEVLALAREYCLKDLTFNIVNKIKGILNTKNAITFINEANKNELNDLGTICHSFIHNNALEILSSDSFSNLTQTSLLEILNRNTLMVPEIEIFKGVAKWCEKNNDTDNLVAEFVLSSLTKTLSVVLPKIVSSETLIKTVSQIDDDNSKDLPFLRVPYADENIASVKRRPTVIVKQATVRLLNGHPVEHKIGDGRGILICLNSQYFVNHIRMQLHDADEDCCYFYYIETSKDGQGWHKVVDYTKYACRSIQELYFERQKCQYIRIVGTRSNKKDVSDFELVWFEAFYKSEVPKTINAVICPEQNVATPDLTVVKAGKYKSEDSSPFLLNGINNHFAVHEIGGDPNCIIVQLAQPYHISTMQLLLNEGCKFIVETSVNGTNWEPLVDRRTTPCSKFEDLVFEEMVVVFIKITGTFTPVFGNTFSMYRIECPSDFTNSTRNYVDLMASIEKFL